MNSAPSSRTPNLALVRAYARAVRLNRSSGAPAPDAWEQWVRALFPRHASHGFADHQRELWGWLWEIESDSSPRPFIAIWARGGAKTTTAELGCTALGVRGKRRYAWYVNETQDKADKNVENIAALLESAVVEQYYPAHAERMVSKFGQSRGWRRNRLRTAGGFTVDALGLDTAQRGLKVEEQRPDLIILDDLDGKLDTPATLAKKVAIITTSILPAGASNVAVLGVQNLIIPDGIFSQLADGRADFLTDRIVSGPHPAIEGLTYEMQLDSDGLRRARVTGGTPTWEGQDLAVCQRMIDTMGLTAFLKECQHMVKELAEGVALQYDPALHRHAWTPHEIRVAIEEGELRPFGGIDFGSWRFAFVLCAADRQGRVHVLHEFFSQRETLTDRAKKIHGILSGYRIERLPLWGDSANPTDILEINTAWKRGWVDKDGSPVKPAWRVGPVRAEGKARATSVERLNDLLGRLALLFRTDLGTGQRWHLGMSAASEGLEQVGSRLMWEMEHWSYPGPREGDAQRQDPDDDTADGADMMAALRYAVISWWKTPPEPKEKARPARNVDPRFDRVWARLQKAQEARRGVA